MNAPDEPDGRKQRSDARPTREPRSGLGYRRWMSGTALPLWVLASVACAGGGPPAELDRAEPVPYADTLPIREPEAREYRRITEELKETVRKEVGHALSPRRVISGNGEALNVTAFDGVVASAWYEPRIGAGQMSPERVAAGPPGADPDTTARLTVVGGKVGGVSPGFTVRDRKGDTYLLKFDPPGYPGLSSGADVIASRLFWAVGYHVPRDVVITIHPDELEVDEGVMIETTGGERPMRRDDIRRALASTDSLPSGRYRALASLFVPGVPKGPFRFEGTRQDDPNDYYPHADRRELRGLWVVASWLEHSDLRYENTLDAWIDPPGYLRHYLIDFGSTLGSGAVRVKTARDGGEHAFDIGPTMARLFTLGLYEMAWERIDDTPIHPSIGWVATESFDAGAWKPFWPNDAYRRMTVRDAYWGAKLVGAFDRAHLEAVVAEAAYRDPTAADTLVEILESRQQEVLRHWYARVTPVENVAIEGWRSPTSEGGGGANSPDSLRIRFDDLGLVEDLWSARRTRYRWKLEGPPGAVGGGVTPATPGTEQLLIVPVLSDRPDSGHPFPEGDTMGRVESGSARSLTLEITALRPGADERPATVTIIPEGSGYRIVRLTH